MNDPFFKITHQGHRFQLDYGDGLSSWTFTNESLEGLIRKVLCRTDEAPEDLVGLRELLFRVSQTWIEVLAAKRGVGLDLSDARLGGHSDLDTASRNTSNGQGGPSST